MKHFYIAVVAISVIFLLVPTVLSAICKPGSTWKVDCNTCFCTNGGVGACTKMACLPKQKRALRECVPFTSWNDGCNDCTCSKDGHPACTEKFCLTPQPIARCVPGTSRRVDCNSCRCTQSGVEICTQRACLPRNK